MSPFPMEKQEAPLSAEEISEYTKKMTATKRALEKVRPPYVNVLAPYFDGPVIPNCEQPVDNPELINGFKPVFSTEERF